MGNVKCSRYHLRYKSVCWKNVWLDEKTCVVFHIILLAVGGSEGFTDR